MHSTPTTNAGRAKRLPSTTAEVRAAFEFLGCGYARGVEEALDLEDAIERDAAEAAAVPILTAATTPPPDLKAPSRATSAASGTLPLTIPAPPSTADVAESVIAAVNMPPTASTAAATATATPVYPVTIYTPAALYNDGDPARGFRPDTTGGLRPCTWADLVRLLGRDRLRVGDPVRYPDAKLAKAARGGYSACELRGGRRLSSAFVSTQLLGLDLDAHGDVEHALEAFARFRKIIHSTYSSTAQAPHCRVILPLADLCTSREHFQRAHDALRTSLITRGLYLATDLDSAGRDPERLWYLPMRHPDREYQFYATDGELLDLGRLAPSESPRQQHPQAACASLNAPSGAYGGALAHAEHKMRMAVEPHRHDTAVAMAFFLANVTPVIPAEVIAATLIPYAPDGREQEWRAAVTSGLRKAGR